MFALKRQNEDQSYLSAGMRTADRGRIGTGALDLGLFNESPFGQTSKYYPEVNQTMSIRGKRRERGRLGNKFCHKGLCGVKERLLSNCLSNGIKATSARRHTGDQLPVIDWPRQRGSIKPTSINRTLCSDGGHSARYLTLLPHPYGIAVRRLPSLHQSAAEIGRQLT